QACAGLTASGRAALRDWKDEYLWDAWDAAFLNRRSPFVHEYFDKTRCRRGAVPAAGAAPVLQPLPPEPAPQHPVLRKLTEVAARDLENRPVRELLTWVRAQPHLRARCHALVELLEDYLAHHPD